MGRPVLNLYRSMGHSPEGLRAYIGLSHFVRDRSSLPPRLRELAILATGSTAGCDYEVSHHVQVARSAGLDDQEIDAATGGGSGAFDELERAVLAYARQATSRQEVDAGTMAVLRQHLSLQQISDLAITTGMYNMVAAVLLALNVEID